MVFPLFFWASPLHVYKLKKEARRSCPQLWASFFGSSKHEALNMASDASVEIAPILSTATISELFLVLEHSYMLWLLMTCSIHRLNLLEDHLLELIFNKCQVTQQLYKLIAIHLIDTVDPSENCLSFLVIHATTRNLMKRLQASSSNIYLTLVVANSETRSKLMCSSEQLCKSQVF